MVHLSSLRERTQSVSVRAEGGIDLLEQLSAIKCFIQFIMFSFNCSISSNSKGLNYPIFWYTVVVTEE
jgi:hypothetical protein